jgi:hypothetical protein
MKTLILLGMVVLFSAAPALAQGAPNLPTEPIELKYYQDGPWSVTRTDSQTCVSKPGAGGIGSTPLWCEIYHPIALGSHPNQPGLGYRHPIVLWGNGTGAALPGAYGYWLRHLASWGFVVIRTNDAAAGGGESLVASLAYLTARNADPASPFFDKLDVSRVGAAGHSQGAAGALNVMTRSGGQIRATLTFHLPFNAACVLPCVDAQALAAATQGAVFYVSGTLDPISPDTQPLPGSLSSNAAFYAATPDALVKVKAILKGGAHNDITGGPTCLVLCHNGVYGYLGYPTAWLVWRLRDTPDGHAAFAAGTGEIFQATENWQGMSSNVD